MDAKKLIIQGGNLREAGHLSKSLQVLGMAITEAGRQRDLLSMLTALGERCLTWKHFYLETNDKAFLALARKDAEAMQLVSELREVRFKIHTSSFLLGGIDMLLGNFRKAVKNYNKALEHFKGTLSEKGDWRYHLGEAIYRSGQKAKGKKIINAGIEEIKKGAKEIPSFLAHVWLSGAYMKLADLLLQDEPEEAIKYLGLAEKIILADKRLVMRKKQLARLKRKF